jgi:pimeloyl-ACP methyl ester carboxylesterase
MTPYLNQTYRIISMDLRGHGKSSAPECCYTLQDLSYDAKLLLDKLGIDKAIVVGHSLGSMVTQVLAENYPERVSKVVLISSTADTDRVTDPNGWLATEIGKLKQPIDPNSQFMLDWYANPNEVNAEFIVKERIESAAVPVNVWRAILVETQTNEFGRRLNYLQAPALIMHGSKDPLFDAQDQDKLKLGLPKAKFIEFPNQGHNIMWEEPKAVAEAINAFISN